MKHRLIELVALVFDLLDAKIIRHKIFAVCHLHATWHARILLDWGVYRAVYPNKTLEEERDELLARNHRRKPGGR